ncbi:S-type pyocin domain-containing protein [Morganella morganii]|uniref:S-type pyocin domain-containing protein n=1 Tax=Morganella morganii TaxID=582 RepID=UPI00339BCDA0
MPTNTGNDNPYIPERPDSSGGFQAHDDNGSVILTTPAPEDVDFNDYILITPVADIPAIYVYLSEDIAKPHEVVNELNDFKSKDFHIGNQTFKLDKPGMKHILERYHPDFWDGSIKSTQSFFNKDMSVSELTDAIDRVMQQNRDILLEKGSLRMYQIEGEYNGDMYTLGLKNGRIGQFYPK